MRFNGQWLACDDGIARPMIAAKMLANDGMWKAIRFLVDTSNSYFGTRQILRHPRCPGDTIEYHEISVAATHNFDSVTITAELVTP